MIKSWFGDMVAWHKRLHFRPVVLFLTIVKTVLALSHKKRSHVISGNFLFDLVS